MMEELRLYDPLDGDNMTTVAQMTKKELEEMIGTVVEQKLLELLGDTDEGLSVRQSLRTRLLRQKQAVAKGLRGQPLDKVARNAGL
jgi:hypothetical protein